jgi:hypothetical protein
MSILVLSVYSCIECFSNFLRFMLIVLVMWLRGCGHMPNRSFFLYSQDAWRLLTYKGGNCQSILRRWPCSNWVQMISRPCCRISALNVTSRDVIWQPCARGLILIDSLIWLGDPSPPRSGGDSSDLTRWGAAGLTAASFCLWDCSDTHVDHVIQCLISLPSEFNSDFGFLWILSWKSPISHHGELIGRLHWFGTAPINKSNCVRRLRLSQLTCEVV